MFTRALQNLGGNEKRASVMKEQSLIRLTSKLLYHSSQIPRVIKTQMIFATLDKGGIWGGSFGDFRVKTTSQGVGNFAVVTTLVGYHFVSQVGWIFSMKKKTPSWEPLPLASRAICAPPRTKGRLQTPTGWKAERGRREVCEKGGEEERGREDSIWAYWAGSLIVVPTAGPASLQSILHTATIDFPKHKSDCLVPLLKTLQCFLLSRAPSPSSLTWCTRPFTICFLPRSISPLPAFFITLDATVILNGLQIFLPLLPCYTHTHKRLPQVLAYANPSAWHAISIFLCEFIFASRHSSDITSSKKNFPGPSGAARFLFQVHGTYVHLIHYVEIYVHVYLPH